jgi:hypothetical protein
MRNYVRVWLEYTITGGFFTTTGFFGTEQEASAALSSLLPGNDSGGVVQLWMELNKFQVLNLLNNIDSSVWAAIAIAGPVDPTNQVEGPALVNTRSPRKKWSHGK